MGVCGCHPTAQGVGTVCLGHDSSHPICAVMRPVLEELISDLVLLH